MNEKELQRISQQAARVGVDVGTTAEAFRRVAEMSMPTADNLPSAEQRHNFPEKAQLSGEGTTSDTISRQAAIDEVSKYASIWMEYDGGMTQEEVAEAALKSAKRTMVHILEEMPSAEPEKTDCEYCREDSEGYVRPIEKNSHAWLIRRWRTMKLRVCFKGEYRECDILFCPMCGRRLKG